MLVVRRGEHTRRLRSRKHARASDNRNPKERQFPLHLPLSTLVIVISLVRHQLLDTPALFPYTLPYKAP